MDLQRFHALLIFGRGIVIGRRNTRRRDGTGTVHVRGCKASAPASRSQQERGASSEGRLHWKSPFAPMDQAIVQIVSQLNQIVQSSTKCSQKFSREPMTRLLLLLMLLCVP